MEGDEPFDDDDAVGMEYVVNGQAAEEGEVLATVTTAATVVVDEGGDDIADGGEHLGMLSVFLHDLGNYTFGDASRGKRRAYRSFAERMIDRKLLYDSEGTARVTVEVVMLAHYNNIPHVLLLRSSNPTITGTVFALPHTHMRAGEDNLASLNRCLNKLVKTEKQWNVVAQIAKWTRPKFSQRVYPYDLPHASHPKVLICLFFFFLF
jgi:hypothetical protein